MSTDTSRPAADARPKPVQWIAGGLSGAMVCGLVAYLAYQGLATDGAPPDISITVERIVESGGRYHVDVVALNGGGSTAADVRLMARTAGEPREESAFAIDYLPSGSERRGTFVFARDPGPADTIAVAVTGYSEP